MSHIWYYQIAFETADTHPLHTLCPFLNMWTIVFKIQKFLKNVWHFSHTYLTDIPISWGKTFMFNYLWHFNVYLMEDYGQGSPKNHIIGRIHWLNYNPTCIINILTGCSFTVIIFLENMRFNMVVLVATNINEK